MPSTVLPRFDSLVERHYSSLFHFAVRLSKSPETAMQLTQRTFRLALDRSRDLPVPANVRSWLFTILLREFLEFRPRMRRSNHTRRSYNNRFNIPAVELILKGNPQLN